MITLVIGKGYFLINDGGKKTMPCFFSDMEMPFNPHLQFDHDKTFNHLPPVSEVYQDCLKLNFSNDQIIDVMLKIYHRGRLFRASYLKNKEITIGFIGHRGSGKSASATGVICLDWLLCPDFNVWSNVPIAIKVVCGDAEKIFESKPLPKLEFLELDESFQNGVAFIDEVNMEVAESSRYMSGTNLSFSYMMQQMRKRGISIVWTAQNWNSIDPRLKWQSDYVVWCQDAFFTGAHSRMGWRSKWTIMDCSGMSGFFSLDKEFQMKYLIDHKIGEMIFFMRPWWNAYDTRKLQGQGIYNKKDLEKQQKQLRGLTANDVSYDADNFLVSIDPDVKIIMKKKFWEENNLVNDRAAQTRVGAALIEAGWVSKRDHWERVLNKEKVGA